MTLAYDYALFAEHCRQAADALEAVLKRDSKRTVPLKADDVRELRTLAEIANERCNELVKDVLEGRADDMVREICVEQDKEAGR